MPAPRVTVILMLALSGCVANESFGRGPITLSPSVSVHFEAYKKLDQPLLFAVSTDGKTGYGVYCKGYRCENAIAYALAECEGRSAGVPCKIFAQGRSVVWDGAVQFTLGGTPSAGAQAGHQKQLLKRVLAFEWAGFQALGAGIVEIADNGKAGTLSLELPDKSGVCTGTFAYSSPTEGVWSASCPDGRRSASGTFQAHGPNRGSEGIGNDNLGQPVRWTISGGG